MTASAYQRRGSGTATPGSGWGAPCASAALPSLASPEPADMPIPLSLRRFKAQRGANVTSLDQYSPVPGNRLRTELEAASARLLSVGCQRLIRALSAYGFLGDHRHGWW